MVGIIILCAVLLMLAVLLLTPVRIRFSYDRGELDLWIRYGPVKCRLFPRIPEEPEAAPKKKKEKKAASRGETPKKKRSFQITKERILYSLETLPPILVRALRRTRRRIRLRPLKIHLLVAGTDPADTALLYGKLEAALGAGLPVLHRLVRVQDQDIRLFPDFSGERMDCIADVGLDIRPWDLISVGLRAGLSLVKWLLGLKRLTPAEDKDTSNKDAAA